MEDVSLVSQEGTNSLLMMNQLAVTNVPTMQSATEETSSLLHLVTGVPMLTHSPSWPATLLELVWDPHKRTTTQ